MAVVAQTATIPAYQHQHDAVTLSQQVQLHEVNFVSSCHSSAIQVRDFCTMSGNRDDGSFTGDKWGEKLQQDCPTILSLSVAQVNGHDPFCALACLPLLHHWMQNVQRQLKHSFLHELQWWI